MKLVRILPVVWVALIALIALIAFQLACPYPPMALPFPSPRLRMEQNNKGSNSELSPELPPPDFPSANVEGYTFDLRYALSAELDKVPREAAVYELLRKAQTVHSVQKIADTLGIKGKVEDRGDGSFTATGNGDLFVTIDMINYFSSAQVPRRLAHRMRRRSPQDDDWLRHAPLLPPDIGKGTVVQACRIESAGGQDYVPAEPEKIRFPGIPALRSPWRADTSVIEAHIHGPTSSAPRIYHYIHQHQAWQLVSTGQAYLAPDLTRAGTDPGTEVSKGRVTFNSISIAYATAGLPGEGDNISRPVLRLRRTDWPEGDDNCTYPITAYVSALSNSGAPVG